MKPYKCREIPSEFYCLPESFIKKVQKCLNRERLENGIKILEIFWENRLEFVEKRKLINILRIISTVQIKLGKQPAKT